LTEPIQVDHPNLLLAKTRLRRMLRFWALLFVAMGAVAWIALGDTHPLAAVQWLAAGLLFVLSSQPAFLVLAAALWGISITSLIPGAAVLLGADPLAILLDTGLFETIVLIFVRVVFAVMAMNQFLFYRMLYGTERMTGIEDSLPDIPEVVPNKTNLLARISAGIALIALIGVGLAWVTLHGQSARYLLHSCAIFASYAVGIGLGSAFSPTDKRGLALIGIFFGALVFLLALSAAPRI
jgi:hypothetical protein